MAINRINLGAVKGETGNTGATGAPGQPGQNGITPHIENGMWYIGNISQNVKAKGDTWYKGNGAPTDQGVNGDLYLDALTSDVYYKQNNVWEYFTNIKGLQGQQGLQGENATSIEIGTVSTVEYGQPATATLTPLGDGRYRLDLGLPRGERGEQGEQGVNGNTTAYVGGFAVNTLSFDSNPQAQINGKVAINQGLQNAGKILVVDSNGNVVPASSEAENDVIDAFIVGSTDYGTDWLSLTPNGDALSPLQGKIYIIKTAGDKYLLQYVWNGTQYEQTGGGDTSGLASKSEAVGSIVMTIDSNTYVVTLQAKDVNGTNLGTAQTIDLPLESVVVNGSYNSLTRKLVLTLQNGNTVEIDISDLISGLQNEITANNKLSADLVDDTNTTNKFTNATEKATWNAKQDNLGITTQDVQALVAQVQQNAQNIYANSQTISMLTDNTTYLNGLSDVERALATKQDIIQYSTLPTASASNVGAIVQYIGTTTSEYTNGHFYKSVTSGGNYGWEEVEFGTEIQTVTTITSQSTDAEVPSAKAVWTLSETKQDVIDSTHKLSADLVDDTNSTNKFVTAQEKAKWNAGGEATIFMSNVSASTWVADSTYTDFGYKCVLSVTGVTADNYADVVFGVTEATSGNYAPVAETGAGTITIYSKVNTAITIPTIRIENGTTSIANLQAYQFQDLSNALMNGGETATSEEYENAEASLQNTYTNIMEGENE